MAIGTQATGRTSRVNRSAVATRSARGSVSGNTSNWVQLKDRAILSVITPVMNWLGAKKPIYLDYQAGMARLGTRGATITFAQLNKMFPSLNLAKKVH